MVVETMLLVGGPCDGRRVKIDGRPKVYYVPRVNRLDLSISPHDEFEAQQISRIAEEYVRCGANVYVHESISNMDIINLLTAGYRPEIGQ